LMVGGQAVARRELGRAKGLRARGTASDLTDLLYVEALLAIAEGNRSTALRKLERGLGLLDQYRAALGAIELRAAASAIGTELAKSGLRLALESCDPVTVLAWSERLRASALRLPAVRPASDPTLQSLQAELRQAVAKGATTQQARLEMAIRARS